MNGLAWLLIAILVLQAVGVFLLFVIAVTLQDGPDDDL